MENHKYSKLKIIILSIILIIIVLVMAKYTTDSNFRSFVDTKIFNKQVTENSLATIEINSDDNPISFAFDNYIGIFSKSKVNIYNNKSNLISQLSVNITTPIISSKGKYVIISEKNGSNFYVINSTSLLWQNSIDGKINKININENGFVSIIASNSTYASIVITYNSDGTELFKTYFKSTYAMCSAISTNNDYLAIGEINYSGTVIKSSIRVMSMSEAKLIYNYSAPDNEIITDIKYLDKEIATCLFTGSIIKVSPSNGEKVYDIDDAISFANINLKDNFSVIERQSSGLFSYEYQLQIVSLTSNNKNLYILSNHLPKQMISSEKVIALNYGNSVDIVNQNGTLKKNYISTQQIKDVITGEKIVGIVYKDKIEIIDV